MIKHYTNGRNIQGFLTEVFRISLNMKTLSYAPITVFLFIPYFNIGLKNKYSLYFM